MRIGRIRGGDYSRAPRKQRCVRAAGTTTAVARAHLTGLPGRSSVPGSHPGAPRRSRQERRLKPIEPRRREAEDNHCVRRLVAATMFVLFASLNAIDGICCPDGCTQEQATTSRHHDREPSDGNCVLCLGGVESAVPHTPSASVTVTRRFAALLLTLHLDAPTDPPDHPPRS